MLFPPSLTIYLPCICLPYVALPCVLCCAALVLSVCSFDRSIDNVKTHLIFEFHFAAFPGKTIRLIITGKSPATLILAGGHS